MSNQMSTKVAKSFCRMVVFAQNTPSLTHTLSHFMHVPFLTKVKFPHSPHISPS